MSVSSSNPPYVGPSAELTAVGSPPALNPIQTVISHPSNETSLSNLTVSDQQVSQREIELDQIDLALQHSLADPHVSEREIQVDQTGLQLPPTVPQLKPIIETNKSKNITKQMAGEN